MKPVYQTKLKAPEGNCFNACVASIIECALEDLPDLCEIEAKGQNWLVGLNEQLRPMGYGVISTPASEENPAQVYIPQGCHFIVSGIGFGGVPHSVVFRQNDEPEFVHDPIGPKYQGLRKVESFQMIVKV